MHPIRTAIIGYGTAGRIFHAPLIAADPAYLLGAIVTSDPTRSSEVVERYGPEVLVPSVDALFARSADFDLIVVASPNETHAPLTHRALDAGLDVVVDKPFALSSAQARKLIRHAETAGRRLTVFQNRRWDGDFLTVQSLVASGELGEVRQFESAFEWWKPELSAGWRDTSSVGGGILFDLGPHLIDQAVRLFGEVEDVHAELDRRRDGAVSDDDSFVTLRHRGGVRSRLWMSAVSPTNRPRFRVVGSQAVFSTTGLDPQERQLAAKMSTDDPDFGTDDVSPDGVWSGPGFERTIPLQRGDYPAFYGGLAKAITSGGELPVNARDSETVQDIIDQIHASVLSDPGAVFDA
ncbi:MAG: oxidoreductase [Microbacteriaceae bacterium]|jgi:scyllo-inositol 2-dehydrogenase (NADP+)|nr:oxidoreductase [Microbacteriaceae bacterium]